MIRKIFTLLTKIKSSTSLCAGFIDLAEFLANAWSFGQHLAIILIAVWVPLLKLAAYLLNNFNIKVNSIIPQHRCALVFWSLYAFSAVASLYNLAAKYADGYGTGKLVMLAAVCLFLLVVDFIETEEFLKKNRD